MRGDVHRCRSARSPSPPCVLVPGDRHGPDARARWAASWPSGRWPARPRRPPTATPLPTPSAPQTPLARVRADRAAGVGPARPAAPPDIGPPDVITRDELAVELEALFDETWTDAAAGRRQPDAACDGAADRGPGHPRADRVAVRRTRCSASTTSRTRRMVVVTDAGLTAAAQITYAHEFTHAMQDAAFDTGRRARRRCRGRRRGPGAAGARGGRRDGGHGAVGVRGNLSPDELAGIGATPLPDMSGIPDWMVSQLEFPYLAGADLGQQLCARPAAGMRWTPPTTSRRPRPSRSCIRRSTRPARHRSDRGRSGLADATGQRLDGTSSRPPSARRCSPSGCGSSGVSAGGRRRWPRPAGAAIG